ncbi:MAG: hypothetical protein DRI36_00940 [Caldiserica bacterium]|nr:MAG: hypothetical protein DRI36_00940 [Caldisericota bacterium]
MVEGFIIVLFAFLCELIDSSLGMLYGTILSPVLIIMGYDPLVVVPSILFSQAIGGIIASIGHHRLKNVDFTIREDIMKRLADLGYIEAFRKSTTRDMKVVFVITCFGILATIIGSLISISISKVALKTYIGVLVLAMGVILLLRSRFNFSWKRVLGIGILSAFNKGISGGGFGPVVTSGQIISGRESRESIGATTLSEAPICITGFLTYLIKNGLSKWNLVIFLTAGAVLGAIIGPHITKKFKSEKKLRLCLGILVTLLGMWTLVKTWLI